MHTWMRRSFVDKALINAYYLGTSFSYYYGLDNCVLDAMSENLPKLGPNPNPQPIPTSSSFIRITGLLFYTVLFLIL